MIYTFNLFVSCDIVFIKKTYILLYHFNVYSRARGGFVLIKPQQNVGWCIVLLSDTFSMNRIKTLFLDKQIATIIAVFVSMM